MILGPKVPSSGKASCRCILFPRKLIRLLRGRGPLRYQARPAALPAAQVTYRTDLVWSGGQVPGASRESSKMLITPLFRSSWEIYQWLTRCQGIGLRLTGVVLELVIWKVEKTSYCLQWKVGKCRSYDGRTVQSQMEYSCGSRTST